MPIDDAVFFARLEELIDDYWDELATSPLALKSIEDYWYFAYCFVRWSKGEFTPGDHVPK